MIKQRKDTLKHTSQRGSTLTWVMIVSIVLTLIIASLLAIVAFNNRTLFLDTTKTQAYYTAQTVNERIVTWLTGTPAPDSIDPSIDDPEILDPYHFVEDLRNGPITQSYTEAELGSNMGTATTTVEFTDSKYNKIKITTIGECAGNSETVSVLMHLKEVSSFHTINPGFDYSAPDVSAALEEIESLGDWEASAQWAKQYSDATSFGANNNWWTYFIDDYSSNIVDYRVDLLAVSPADYDEASKTLRHDYGYLYLQNRNFPANTNKKEVHIDLDPSRGAFFLNQSYDANVNNIPAVEVGGSQNPVIAYPFPYNNTTLRSTVKGVFLAIDSSATTGVVHKVAHDKIVYYTRDHEGFDTTQWPHITLGSYVNTGSNPSGDLTSFENLSLYITDSSDKLLEVNSGLDLSVGTIYTTRNTNIGTVFDDSGAPYNAQINNYTKNTDLYLRSYNLIFADPGKEDQRRVSLITGTTYYNGVSQTVMDGGNIVVQNNHELIISAGTYLDLYDSKGIVVEAGGVLSLEGNAVINSNIFVASGAVLSINGPVTIAGNIFCSGTLNINSTFTMKALDNNTDNYENGYVTNNPEHGNCTGIFIYNDDNIGIGSLNVADGCTINSPYVGSERSNKIHSFVSYPDLSKSLFCDHVPSDSKSNLCPSWETKTYVWVELPGSTHESIPGEDN